MLSNIKNGDKSVTGGGVYATVVDASDPVDVDVEIAEGVKVSINRATIRDLLKQEAKSEEKKAKPAKVANANKKTKK